ncbi:hypothetical protein GM415_06405 [Pseudodesulfovibrio cashew]|uniref:Uncharacterized protein n=1 Tax=Pseudodesulfovibrio cashew TaxID=2678688 RepID=A0A6I6JAH6_9BACT|nr:hypothetical protein [Pseudodesulfovibrio cashew]QGY39766.1 hypothetical protein GM415_06405 [Pseudodesulfovibrio cashew]
MKGFFDNPNEAFGPGDTNGVFSYDPASNTTRRSWIKYADGVFEPVRKDGNLRRKKNEDHRTFSWWQVNKPADWKPADEGAGFSWNHTLGSRDDLADQKTGVPFAAPAGGQSGGNQEKSKEGTPDQPETAAPGKPAPPSTQGKADGPAAPAPPLRTLLGLGSKALEGREEQPAPTNPEKAPAQAQTPQRNVAQDARDLADREKRTISAEEHARDLARLEREQDARDAKNAAASGALGGMVQSKGQGKKGKASGNDPMIDDFIEEYNNARNDRQKNIVKRRYMKKVDNLRKESKTLKGKEKTRLKNRADQWAGLIKILTDGKVRMGPPLTIFNKDIVEELSKVPIGSKWSPDNT